MIRRTRVIPVLLLRGRELVKSMRFTRERYVGDVLNTVRIFNEKEADEIMVLDIDAAAQGRPPDTDLILDIAGECFMPLTYGGGVRTLEDMEKLFAAGCEKVAVQSMAFDHPELLTEAARVFGSQSLAAVVDVRRLFWGGSAVTDRRGRRVRGKDPVEWVEKLQALGAGEIVLQSVDRDGTRSGYNLELIQKVCARVSVPVVALGGAAGTDDFRRAAEAGASAVAAGSFFVFHGKHQAVLITYPNDAELSACLP